MCVTGSPPQLCRRRVWCGVGGRWQGAGMDFIGQDLRGSRFIRSDLAGAVMRGVKVAGLDIDSHDLPYAPLVVNGVDVVPYVEAELDRLFPGRGLRSASDPAGLRSAWSAVETAWAAAVETARGREDVSVDGEWTFSQTLRHLVLATNAWLHGAVLRQEQPFHPIGQPFAEYAEEGFDTSIFREPASYDEVLAVRADHQAMVRDFLADVTPETLAERRPDPWAPEDEVTVLDCLQVILDEEWDHLRYALRDLEKV
ncbi:DinB family protein [Nocardioides sp. TF02-7]|uniref:DinB family protein n=1 Tax=Nocardioides sp. TF02-7 TaxID=2917724 RepID=UPI001F065497|nr:DinB family protein [Nocardioides sp. TF02-7]UMG91672.1 DinB family protein [Nocardioides sp. TF02-7]